eukprot:jgi/Picsp_1/6349/NSC_03698-R1_nucleoside-diphosphate-sugar epimerase
MKGNVDPLRVPLTMTEASQPAATCLVSGASGYLGSTLVKRLLASGHTVHATSRDKEKLFGLYSLSGAKDGLLCFECDLIKPGSFEQAIKGVTHVFHVASPVMVQIGRSDVEHELLRPAVQGIENILSSCTREPSVRRVVVTSSVGAMAHDFWEKGKDHLLCEEDWNETSSADSMPYKYSKVLAEKKAWEMEAQQSDRSVAAWKLVVINPGMCWGPPVLDHATGQAIRMAKDLLAGKYKNGFPAICMPVVDVEDVAKAHAMAAFSETAHGQEFDPSKRYMGRETPRFVAYLYFKATKRASWEFIKPKLNKIPLVDNSKVKRDLQMDFYDVTQSVVEMLRKFAAAQSNHAKAV